MNICEWYDYESCSCNIDDEYCPFAADNNKGMYGIGLSCEKISEMKTINDNTIYCTEEQTRSALEMGSQIEVHDTFDSYDIKESNIFYKDKFIELSDGRLIERITTEQMRGWLEEQGIFIVIDMANSESFDAGFVAILKQENNIKHFVGIFSESKKATLAAIDAALECLTNNKK